ncbi:15713_t:CDS:2, partial [Racocetra fulgida]
YTDLEVVDSNSVDMNTEKSERVKIKENDSGKYKFQIIAEPSQITLVEVFSKSAKYLLNHSKQKKLNNNLAAFITEELQPFSDLDPQANILNNDQLKEILINAEDRVLQKEEKCFTILEAHIEYHELVSDNYEFNENQMNSLISDNIEEDIFSILEASSQSSQKNNNDKFDLYLLLSKAPSKTN